MARLALIMILAAAGAAGSEHCYGVDNRMTLMPDGSGKVDVVHSCKLEEKADPKEPFDLLKFEEFTRGVVALTPAKTEIKDGWRHDAFTAYFEDINKLYYNADGPQRPCDGDHDECLHFSVARDGAGFVLTMEDWIFNRGPGRGDPTEKWEEVRAESANVVKWTLDLPGKATKVDGFQRVDGRQVSYERSPRTIAKLEDAVKWPVCARRRIEFGKNEIGDAEVAAFRKQLAAAKAAWQKLKSDLEAARARKK